MISDIYLIGESTLADIDNLAQLVIDQTSCSKAAAVKALNETNGDVVAAIMVSSFPTSLSLYFFVPNFVRKLLLFKLYCFKSALYYTTG
jgi:hypothetical protein